MTPGGAAFLANVARVLPRTSDEGRARVGSRLAAVTPPARAWGIEIEGHDLDATPDFGCVIPVEEPVPEVLRSSRAFRLLDGLAGPSMTDGRWFFEVDCGRGGTIFHSFARVEPAARPKSTFVGRVCERAPVELAAATTALRRLATEMPDCSFSDLGVVVREGAVEARFGVLAGASAFGELLAQTEAHPLARAFEELTPLVADGRCVFQLGIGTGVPRCTGIEIPVPSAEAGWAPVLNALVEHGWLDEEGRAAALAWRGSERVPPREGSAPTVLAREISHAKLVAHGGAISTKLYLAASETLGIWA